LDDYRNRSLLRSGVDIASKQLKEENIRREIVSDDSVW
jgi:hypothetical protein